MKPTFPLLLISCITSLHAGLISSENGNSQGFDQRQSMPVDVTNLDPERQTDLASIKTGKNVRVDFDDILGTPHFIAATDGLLTDVGGKGLAGIESISTKDKNRVVKAYLNQHRALFGEGEEMLLNARIKKDDSASNRNGMRNIVWEQQLDGIPVYEGIMQANLTKDGSLINIGSRFVPNIRQVVSTGLRAEEQSPPISKEQAFELAAAAIVVQPSDQATQPSNPVVNNTGAKKTNVSIWQNTAELVWLPMSATDVRLCWQIVLGANPQSDMYRILIDAQTGQALISVDVTEHISDATYQVWTSDSPSPFSPGFSSPSTNQPALTSRSLVTFAALDTNASPEGWVQDASDTTYGNNAYVDSDTNGDYLQDQNYPLPVVINDFEYPLDLMNDPSAYIQASMVNAFYWVNFMHDNLYDLGFTESAGNFQNNNYTNGGIGGDRMNVLVQCSRSNAVNNSFFSFSSGNPADGANLGYIVLGKFTGPTPDRDAALDSELICHEYTHGLSQRLVGGGVGFSALQTKGMGEGWSDFYALSLLSESSDDVNANYAMGAYVGYHLGTTNYNQNYYFGIRRYPYSTSLTNDPVTYKDIAVSQMSQHTGIPRIPSTVISTSSTYATEVHNMGEIWCAALWGARAALITKYGYSIGNERILKLVTDGMKLAPANPTFLQARDAIFQADLVDNSSADAVELRQAFAIRGMGTSATSPASTNTVGVHEAFDVAAVSGLSISNAIYGVPTAIIGTNLYNITAVTVGGSSVSYTTNSLENITVNPANFSGAVTVTSLGQELGAGTFTQRPQPFISIFTPASTYEGSSVVINGANFYNVTSVNIGSWGPDTTNFVVNSSTKITAVVPMGAYSGNPTFGPIRVHTLGGGIAMSSTTINILESIPTISSFTPTSGLAGTTVTINGTKFYDVAQVDFNSNPSLTMTVVSPTQITATVPTGSSTGKIQLITTGFHTVNSAASFTVTKPTISSFSPTSGSVGSTLTINGTNLSNVQQIQFASSAIGGAVYTTNVTVVSSTQITAVVPATAITGQVTVWSYLNDGISSGTSTVNFTVTP